MNLLPQHFLYFLLFTFTICACNYSQKKVRHLHRSRVDFFGLELQRVDNTTLVNSRGKEKLLLLHPKEATLLEEILRGFYLGRDTLDLNYDGSAEGVSVILNQQGLIEEISVHAVDYPVYLGDLNLKKFKSLKRLTLKLSTTSMLTSLKLPDSTQYFDLDLYGDFNPEWIRLNSVFIDTLQLQVFTEYDYLVFVDTCYVNNLLIHTTPTFRPDLKKHLLVSNVFVEGHSNKNAYYAQKDLLWLRKGGMKNIKVKYSETGYYHVTASNQ